MTEIQLKQLENDVLSLLTDQNVGFLVKDGQLNGEQEEFGALVATSKAFQEISRVFNQVKA